ncbi:MAG: FKBP-type peptidyl-prolyl cis-trans isomerase, partial [Thermoanaerobaculia bacterium]
MELSEPRPLILSALPRRRSLLAALTLTVLGSSAVLSGQTAPGAAPPGPPPKPLTPPPAAPTPQELATPPASAKKLPSGMSTLLLRAGTGKVSPRTQDWIAFFAVGRRTDGTVVQNTFASPDPIRMQMHRLIPAWQTAFAAMVAGEQRRFWFPAELAPKNPQTGAQEAIIFDLELVAVLRTADPPAALKTHDPKATQAGLGAWTLTVKPGKPGPKATRQDAALLNFTVWNDLGQALSTSTLDGRPTLFPLSRVMTSFADCVEGMTVGEVRHCW